MERLRLNFDLAPWNMNLVAYVPVHLYEMFLKHSVVSQHNMKICPLPK